MDTPLENAKELFGNIAIVERGGKKVHFPDVIRMLQEAGVIGCVFLERGAFVGPKSVHEGYHTSSAQDVSFPIIRLSKFHADQFLYSKVDQARIVLLHRKEAIEHLVQDDICIGLTVATRAGEVSVLNYLLGKIPNTRAFEVSFYQKI